jgi:vesicle coat complex subunit
VTLERAAERCINVLLELIKQKVNYVVQEAVVVIKDIFRRYPNRHGLHHLVFASVLLMGFTVAEARNLEHMYSLWCEI